MNAKIKILLLSILIILLCCLVGYSTYQKYEHKKIINQVSTTQQYLYENNLIPTFIDGLDDEYYKIENISCLETAPSDGYDYALELNCDFYIDDVKYNFPVTVLVDKNDIDNPKYQYEQSKLNRLVDAVADKKEEIAIEERKNEIIQITAKELYTEYNKNEVNADDLYSGKTGIIRGKIRKISVISDKPFIKLSNGENNSILGVNCYFADNSQSDIISTLKKGKNITIKGTIRGMYLSDVCIDDCEIYN